MKKRVVVGMSGGVDSSVAALILKQRGYDVVGLFMHNWEESENGFCTAEQDYADVRSVCASLQIPYYSVNFSKEYADRVFSHFLKEYEAGRTPNPDVLCNREIKFDTFKNFCKTMQADYIATGHYCAVEKLDRDSADGDFFDLTAKGASDGQLYALKRARCREKDQTYFLNQLSCEQLKDVIFPLQDMEKHEVRELAQRYGLSTAQKKDSTGICFIGERKFKDFLTNYLPAKSGDIKDINGNLIGKHDGLMYYTIGQRKGLNIGGKSGGAGDRWFVIEKDLTSNTLIVSEGEHQKLYSSALTCQEFNFILPPKQSKFKCTAMVRYRQPEQSALATVTNGSVHLEFEVKQRAVTQGQYAVIYHDSYCMGGGVITAKHP